MCWKQSGLAQLSGRGLHDPVNALYEAALEISSFLDKKQWRFCIIGGLAVIRWGEPRLTVDVDLTLLTGFGEEARYARDLLAEFHGRREEALDFAMKYRVLLLRAANGRDLDISFGAFPFEEEMVERSSRFEFADGVALVTCSAEDLFVLKVFAARSKDWADAESVAHRQKLDRDYIFRHLKPLCEAKEAPDLLVRAEDLLRDTQ
jgi:hypothetical protein